MIANYHTHTWRCGHAVGTEKEYIETAVEDGLKILGFSDHTPYFFPGEYYSHFRMRPEQLEDYVQTVRSLRNAFQDRIEIHVGLELEYYPELLPELLPVLQSQGIEYLLLGQHVLGNEIGEHYSGRAFDDEHILRRYCHQCMDAMNTGLFTYFAHPDLIYYTGAHSVYRKYMRELCREARGCGLPLEINLAGMAAGRNYPDARFWQIAAEEGCRAVLGKDAHAPEEMLTGPQEKKALTMAKAYQLEILDTVKLQPIR